MRTAILTLILTVGAFVALADDPPRPAPPFTIMRAGAPPIQLSQYHGKVVALVLINTGCPHCQALTGTLGPVARDYAAKGVQFIEVAFSPNSEQTVPGFIQQFQPPFPVGWSSDPAVRALLSYTPTDPRLSYVPHVVFLDAKGMIRDDYPAETDFFKNPETNTRAELDKLLKGPAPTAGTAGVKKKQ
jgi:thiol-disulfide isomerase/thioredoxin